MSRTLICSFLLVFALAACKKEKPAPAAGGGSTETPGAAGAGSGTAQPATPPATPPAKPVAGCALTARVAADTTITKGCSVPVKESVTVDDGATLTIEPGAKLLFEPDTYLWITKGKLVAKGTKDAPITFTSAAKTPAANDWIGLFFDDNASAGNVLDFVVVEYAGKSASGGAGGITVRGSSGGRVSITNSEIRKNAQAGVANLADKTAFAKFENNTLADNAGTSLKVRSAVLGSVGAGNKLGDPLHVEGNVTSSQTWPTLDQPIIVDDSINVGGEKSAAILTLADKTTIKFTMGKYLWIGTDNGGGLKAKDCTFTSANSPASAGDWVGIFFDAKTTGTVLEGCTVEYAGREESGGAGAITFRGLKADGVKITKLTMKENKKAGFAGLEGQCGDLVKEESGNKSEGVDICPKPAE
jgi:hypothetical protein